MPAVIVTSDSLHACYLSFSSHSLLSLGQEDPITSGSCGSRTYSEATLVRKHRFLKTDIYLKLSKFACEKCVIQWVFFCTFIILVYTFIQPSLILEYFYYSKIKPHM